VLLPFIDVLNLIYLSSDKKVRLGRSEFPSLYGNNHNGPYESFKTPVI